MDTSGTDINIGMDKKYTHVAYSFALLATIGVLANLLLVFFTHVVMNINEDVSDVFAFGWIISFKALTILHLLPLTAFSGIYIVWTHFHRMAADLADTITDPTQESRWYKTWAVVSGSWSALVIVGTMIYFVFGHK